MTNSENHAILVKLDSALEVYRRTEARLTPRQVRTHRLMQLLREQLAEDIETGNAEDEKAAAPNSPLTF